MFPLLEHGEFLDQPTFHARYEAAPESFRAELIGGKVLLPERRKQSEGRLTCIVSSWLCSYEFSTPGTEALAHPTLILGPDSEPEPYAVLRVTNGQTSVSDDEYLTGPPELTAEVASSTASYDLHSKRRDYERYGVQEYIVVVHEQKVVWFAREHGRFVELQSDADGILRSRVFPGLRLDPDAFFRLDVARLQQVLQEGLSSSAHQEFVAKLRQQPGR